jgi:hypothetical protein
MPAGERVRENSPWQNPGDDLDDEEEECDPAQVIRPHGSRNLYMEQSLDERICLIPAIKPFDDAGASRPH